MIKKSLIHFGKSIGLGVDVFFIPFCIALFINGRVVLVIKIYAFYIEMFCSGIKLERELYPHADVKLNLILISDDKVSS